MTTTAKKTVPKKKFKNIIAPRAPAERLEAPAPQPSTHEGWSALDDGLARECETLSHQHIH